MRPGARIREGAELSFGDGRLTARVESVLPDGKRVASLSARDGVAAALSELGAVPLPPYIDREPEALDNERYQTVYARVPGAVAAPTAGLHFTTELLSRAARVGSPGGAPHAARRYRDVPSGRGRGSSRACDGERTLRDLESHRPRRSIPRGTKAGGWWRSAPRRSASLESVADDGGHVLPGSGSTDIFIRPPYRFSASMRSSRTSTCPSRPC